MKLGMANKEKGTMWWKAKVPPLTCGRGADELPVVVISTFDWFSDNCQVVFSLTVHNFQPSYSVQGHAGKTLTADTTVLLI